MKSSMALIDVSGGLSAHNGSRRSAGRRDITASASDASVAGGVVGSGADPSLMWRAGSWSSVAPGPAEPVGDTTTQTTLYPGQKRHDSRLGSSKREAASTGCGSQPRSRRPSTGPVAG